jgi:N-acetylmuramoyl-L-alanine amidase
MRRRVRLLFVLAIAPVAAFVAGFQGSATHAQAAPAGPPQPIVIAVDPGHGGLPDNAHPTQPFDPGAIAASGLMEKDVALDIGVRLAALLRDDLVSTVLTRSDDRYVTIPDREQTAINAKAALFVSVHCNSFTDPSIGGSLVLYPNDLGQPLAQAVSDALGRGLSPSGVGDDGIQLRDNWWINNPMPTATAEVGYLSNLHEAELLGHAQFRQQVAAALRDGIERFDPGIATRRAEISAWRATHPSATPRSTPTARPAATSAIVPPSGPADSSAFSTVLVWVIGVAAAAAVVRWRGPLRHAAARRRRRRVRTQRLLRGEQPWTRARSVYDDLSL